MKQKAKGASNTRAPTSAPGEALRTPVNFHLRSHSGPFQRSLGAGAGKGDRSASVKALIGGERSGGGLSFVTASAIGSN